MPFRNPFTYRVPDDFVDSVKVGVRVVVPFGKRILTGFVIGVSDTTDVKDKLKNVLYVLDENPIFSPASLKFYEWISEYYLCSLGEALRNSVPYGSEVESKRKVVSDTDFCGQLLKDEKNPKSLKAKLLEILAVKETHTVSQLQKILKKKNIYSALKSLEKAGAVSVLDIIEDAKVKVKMVKHVRLAKSIDDVYEQIPQIESKSPKQLVILLELISCGDKPVQMSYLLNKTKTHQTSLNSLTEKGLVEIFDREVERVYEETYSEAKKNVKLTPAQKEIVDLLKDDITGRKFNSYLLYGVTGSGKTQVYIELSKIAIKKNKAALILVPEISLTPQITSRFYNVFGSLTTVIHSRLSLGERFDAWRGIIKGKYRVVIGPRSALFAPLKDIGIIVVDEEHDSSYKQNEVVPKYNARDAAIVRASQSACPVLLGSATPSMESMHNARTGKYKLLRLEERVDNAKMPFIKLVDITAEKREGGVERIFSRLLIDEIGKRLTKKENVIILQNRRGFSTQVYCEDCSHVEMCPNCDVSLVHHINKNMLQCHYCGFTEAVPRACRNCGSLSLKYFGTGTQRVEDELAFYFPEAKIERIDSDSTAQKGQLGLILNSFRKGEIDILVGTQMVAKGLDFANVTLVGVVSAETTLWLPDFRADERTFQLLTQVAGRSGRSETHGEVIIQTRNQKHFVLQKVMSSDYEGFYNNEIALREKNFYPPFTRIALIECKDQVEQDARQAINDFYKYLNAYKNQVDVTPPAPALISRIKGFYRFHLMARTFKTKDPAGHILRTAITNAQSEYYQKSRYKEIKLIVDIDPVNII